MHRCDSSSARASRAAPGSSAMLDVRRAHPRTRCGTPDRAETAQRARSGCRAPARAAACPTRAERGPHRPPWRSSARGVGAGETGVDRRAGRVPAAWRAAAASTSSGSPDPELAGALLRASALSDGFSEVADEARANDRALRGKSSSRRRPRRVRVRQRTRTEGLSSESLSRAAAARADPQVSPRAPESPPCAPPARGRPPSTPR